jgi:hypothetical protein
MNPVVSMGPGQVVDAVAGFGYGAIGADVHVFADGMPLYILRNRNRKRPALARTFDKRPPIGIALTDVA